MTPRSIFWGRIRNLVAIHVTEHTVKTGSHTTFFLASGPADGPLIVFVHGWPELSISWRHQLPCMASLGFRAIAPDMRGYGRSSVYDQHSQYAQELIVADMIQLLDALGRDQAIWVGHDWGSPVVWNMASHHPDRCAAVANLCVPYYTLERGLEACVALVDRNVYPVEQYPAGQWEYQLFYQEHFARATAVMEANIDNTVKLFFRKGNPAGQLQPSATARVRINGGWFNGAEAAPDLPRDQDVVTEEDQCAYTSALERNGFFGPNSYYMNHEANAKYAEQAVNEGYLDMPTLFVIAAYDYTCEGVTSRLAEPMKTYCRNLTVRTIKSGHWMAQEKPFELNAVLVE
jgi:soluble epoxide hydrolase / lipid-phosphate phosphatase